MSRTFAETRNLFDKWANTYHDDLENPVGPLDGYAHSLQEASEMAEIKTGSAVLDIGIGTGGFAQKFTDRTDCIYGIDISEQMLVKCAELNPGFSLKVGSFVPIPHDDQMFELVVASFCFHEVLPEERQEACHEMFRVLKPGGQVCLLDIIFASQAAEEDAERTIRA